jgi:hypothetical protein
MSGPPEIERTGPRQEAGPTTTLANERTALPIAVHEVAEFEVATAYWLGLQDGVRLAGERFDRELEAALSGGSCLSGVMSPTAAEVVRRLVRSLNRGTA